MKKKNLLTLVSAALLASAPIVPVVMSANSVQIVKADTLTPDELMESYYKSYNQDDPLVKLSKKTPYITAYAGETVDSLTKRRVKDVTSNYGRVSKLTQFNVYKAFDNGTPNLNARVSKNDKLKANENYVAILSYSLTGLKDSEDYFAFKQDYDSNDDLDWYGAYNDQDNAASIIVPLNVQPASVKAKSSTKGYINVRRNHKVRTYTSSGRFSHRYVYGHYTYSFSAKKNIKHHGICYKLSGKNQYVPVSKVTLR